MPVWRVICAPPGGVCPLGLVAPLDADEEATARTEYALHAGHGARSLHYCNDTGPIAERWDDRHDPRAHYEEAT